MKKHRKRYITLAPSTASQALLVELLPSHVGMFRFLLEGYDHLAGFTVINRHKALLKVFFSAHQHAETVTCLHAIQQEIPLTIKPWPISDAKLS